MHRRSLKGALIENKEFNQMVFFGVVFRGTNEEESTGAIYINFPDKEHRNFSVNCEGVPVMRLITLLCQMQFLHVQRGRANI